MGMPRKGASDMVVIAHACWPDLNGADMVSRILKFTTRTSVKVHADILGGNRMAPDGRSAVQSVPSFSGPRKGQTMYSLSCPALRNLLRDPVSRSIQCSSNSGGMITQSGNLFDPGNALVYPKCNGGI